MSSSRPTRSRVSSPFVSGSRTTTTEGSASANTSTAISAKDKTSTERSFMERWIEPPMPAPRASFQEAGLERHNVVLNMAPLGTLPSQKIRKSALGGKPDGGAEGFGRFRASASTPSVATPEPSAEEPEPEPELSTEEPSAEEPAAEEEPATEPRRQSVSTNKREEKIYEFIEPLPSTPPQIPSPRQSISRLSLPPLPGSGQGVFPAQPSPAPSATHAFRSAAQYAPPIAQMTGGSHFREVNFGLCDRVVEQAVQDALDSQHYPTAYALRTLFDDHRANIRIVRLIESIYTESATDEQRTEFNAIMRHKKKVGKRGRTAEYYFNGDGSDPPPVRPVFQTMASLTTPAPPYRSPYATDAQRPASLAVSDGRASASSFYQHQSPAPDFTDYAHVSKKQKTNDYQNMTDLLHNGDMNGFNDFGNAMDDHMMDMDEANMHNFEIGEAGDSLGDLRKTEKRENFETVVAPNMPENMENVEDEMKNGNARLSFQDGSLISLMPESPSPAVMTAAASGKLPTPSPPASPAAILSMEIPGAELMDSDLDADGESELIEPDVETAGEVEMLEPEVETVVEPLDEEPKSISEAKLDTLEPTFGDYAPEKHEVAADEIVPEISKSVNEEVASERPDPTFEEPTSEPVIEEAFLDETKPATNMPSDLNFKVNSPAQAAETHDEQRKSRSRSSSLSSVSEHAIDGAFASANNSPAAQAQARTFRMNPLTGLPYVGSGNANLFGLPLDQPAHRSPYGSPYANAQTFSAVAETVVRKSAPKSRGPINKPGPKFHTFAVTPSTISGAAPPSSTNPSNNSANTNASDQTSTIPSMAPVVIPSPSTTSLPSTGPKLKVKIGNLKKLQGRQALDENDQASLMKRKARETAQANYQPKESFDRHQVIAPSSQDFDSQSDGPDFIQVAQAKRPVKKQKQNRIVLKTRGRETRHSSARPNNYDSEEAPSSPTVLGFHLHLAPGSTPSSRAGTPSNSSRQPTRKARTGTGLRVKSSPMKKKGGTAGLPRGGERNHSPVPNGVPSTAQDGVENDDFCSACGGNGDLVCCDGRSCPRSFHFKCVDPPLVDDLPEEWFCNECDAPQRPLDDYKGLYGYLFFNLDSKCPRAFSLPAPIRDYFEDVKTGTEGEYEEIQPQKPKNLKGWEEPPDYFRLKDSKGNSIFCHHCNGQAEAPSRSIINCTFCTLNWHMDCMPVPLAREPGPGRPWKCPAHVDDVLTKLPIHLGPAHKFRRIKGSKAIRPYFSRGMKNNGYIEVENENAAAEQEPNFYVQKEYGHVYKLPELGIKLDFITKVKNSNAQFQRDLPNASSRVSSSVDSWNSHSLEEQQAALNIASLLEPSDQTTRLINTLITEAPPAVVALIARGSSDTIGKPQMTKGDKQSLAAAIEALQARLEAAGDEVVEAMTGVSSREPSSAVNGDSPMAEKEDEEMIMS